MTGTAPPSSTNWEKFQTGNPLVRRLIDRFYDRIASIVRSLAPSSLLDAGCGEGETLSRLERPSISEIFAVDTSAPAVAYTRDRFPEVSAGIETVCALPFPDGRFDLVLCLEVLEHLEDPRRGIAELRRVSARDVVISVPHEPWFRLGSLLRGKYLRTLGNHPEHLNHWNGRTLRSFLTEEFGSVQVTRSFPWLIAHCRR